MLVVLSILMDAKTLAAAGNDATVVGVYLQKTFNKAVADSWEPQRRQALEFLKG